MTKEGAAIPDDVKLTVPEGLQDGTKTNITCTARNGYPAPLIHWYIGSRNVTGNSTLRTSINSADRYDAESNLTFVLNRFDHGNHLLCQAVQPDTPLYFPINASVILNLLYSSTPYSHPRSTFSTHRRPKPDNNFNSLLRLAARVRWRVSSDVHLEYCPKNTLAKEEECSVVTNLTQLSLSLDGLNQFTWYVLSLWAQNSAGNSSMLTTVASTAPLQPENYGLTVTREKEGQVLQLSKANQSLGDVCFIWKASQESCRLVDGSRCIDPGTNISIDQDDDVVVVTYGRGLCSEPAFIKDLPGQKGTSNNRRTPYMTIAIGVIVSVGFIILISPGLMYCTRRKKERYGD
ncbi:uncharacterized protein LOC121419721 [Lytechinus variegatus]|uniref:uncharacterized protein LOC121419721 n=1 Tax=Lytechinus variegatus TaxID=7654 RepID=UPI001BB0E20A|nr:uncharacterized protein LOC121419721 [Lytechinus variegatus]